MYVSAILKQVFTLLPIVGLLALGLTIALRSGPSGTGTAATAGFGPWATHTWRTFACLAASVLALLAINQAVGVRLALGW